MRKFPVGATFIALATFGAGHALAQRPGVRVTGTVTDTEGRALDGATVEVLGAKASAVTGADGTYRLEAPDGQRWILVRRIGYAPVRITATLEHGVARSLPFELEPLPVRLSEVTVLAEGGMSRYRYQDFLFRSKSAFGRFLTRDDLARSHAYDVISAVQRHLPGRSRFTLEQRGGGFDFGFGRPFFHPVSAIRPYLSNCPPAVSVNGSRPWAGMSLADFRIEEVEAIEIYRRGNWVPTEFAYREGSGCGLVVVWLR